MRQAIPVVDRRRRKRIVTLRNFGFLALAIVIVIAALNIRSEMKDTTGDDYGRLYGREIKKAPPVETVPITESSVAPVDEAPSADPFSLEAASREQYLGSPSLTPEPVIRTDTAGSDTRIVGGPEGVGVVKDNRPLPKLGGGFGRP